MIAPPLLPPRLGLDDDDRLRRARLRLWQISWSLATILVMVWLMTLGPIPGIIGVITAKHILVAILVMGLGVDGRPPEKKSPTAWE